MNDATFEAIEIITAALNSHVRVDHTDELKQEVFKKLGYRDLTRQEIRAAWDRAETILQLIRAVTNQLPSSSGYGGY